jgi:NAD(P)-dependent dehydrogenase (short-subunit alcohol dehydrogenase family)
MKLHQKLALGALGVAAGLAGLDALQGRDRYTFRGKVVLITGGARGLGLLMARRLAGEGAKLALVARDEAELRRAAEELRGRGAEVLAFVCDVRDRGQCEVAVERVVTAFGRIDVLINNAGVIQVGPIEHATLEDYQQAMETHFWGPLYLSRAAVPHMRERGEGRIVNISSIGGLVSIPHLAPYCASKHALVGLSDAMRAELAPHGIRVTTVCPGLMRTGSHYNALVRGQHEREFALFSLFDALPASSIDAGRAADQVLDACRRGLPHLTISVQAQLIKALDTLLPNLTGAALALTDRVLPGADGRDGDELRTGWESQSALAPSALTTLADRATLENNELPAAERGAEERT